ncbi:hypothetical protein BCR41DRAFT_422211 [Lobosporangium transversale]|uniref:Uncharacterized protein n=1 Tax=Lobosporangium transversale TaxID=64571 RepID=A0A1Y2GM04_9FUNG|nr:hypothetical protein BCR41DRAFT_422211 [Lobosporangium transversale]ORZ15410.1 hypothetical protein BCR41DRAFT_422211 [Lobosporangium transversale]|eukprot:XP_021881158.1 hypothetical protein BCR41DRAFT_422211 [Lobosporangium transversale]
MSTSSDGHRTVRSDDHHVLRQKYKSVKYKLSQMEEQLDDVHDERNHLQEINDELHSRLSSKEKELVHTRNLLESNRNHGMKMGEDGKENTQAFGDFKKILCFIEDSLSFIPPVPEHENQLLGRIATIMTHLRSKEEQIVNLTRANQQLTQQIERRAEDNGAQPDKPPREKVEAVLTRVMQQHEITVAKLQSELESAKKQLELTRNIDPRNTRETLEANLSDARTQIQDLQGALARAERGKSAAMASKDQKALEVQRLQREVDDMRKNTKAKQYQIEKLLKELAEMKDLYNNAKTRSLVEDIDKIQKLTARLKDAESQIYKAKKAALEKQEELSSLQSKYEKLQDEKNGYLKKQGLLQEELAAKDLELANARSTSAGFDSSVRSAERERDAAVKQALREAADWSAKLQSSQYTISSLTSERDFLMSALAMAEEQLAEQASQKQQESSQSQQKDNLVASLQFKLESAEGKIQALLERQSADRQLLDDHQQKIRFHEQRIAALQVKAEEANIAKRRRSGELGQFYQILDAINENSENITAVPTTRSLDDDLKRTQVKAEDGSGIPSGPPDSKAWHQASVQIQQMIGSGLEEKKLEKNVLIDQMRQQESKIVDLEKKLEEEKEAQARVPEMGATLTIEEEEELRSDLIRALNRIDALEEQLASLEEDFSKMTQVHSNVCTDYEEKKQTISTLMHDVTCKEGKIATLERDLMRRKQDLAVKTAELVDCRTKLQEQELRANLLEEEGKSLRNRVAELEKIKAEQLEQLDGRERALKRLEEARKLYGQVDKSTIDRLKEEKAANEKLVLAELKRLKVQHEEELQKTVTECSESLTLAQTSHDRIMESWQSEVADVQRQLREQQAHVEELEQEVVRMAQEIDERNVVITGYMALVTDKDDQNMLQEGSELFQSLLKQYQNVMQQKQALAAAMQDQHSIMERYNANMEDLANRGQMYLRQGQERELELASEKKARLKEQQEYKQQLAAKDAAIEALGQELKEKTNASSQKEVSHRNRSTSPLAQANDF